MSESWHVYVLVSPARRTYVGITLDPEKRLDEHNGVRPGGAKATRAGRPWKLAALYGPYESRGRAQQVEHAVKKRRGPARLDLPDEPRVLIRSRRRAS